MSFLHNELLPEGERGGGGEVEDAECVATVKSDPTGGYQWAIIIHTLRCVAGRQHLNFKFAGLFDFR